jgi:hypothetical protein
VKRWEYDLGLALAERDPSRPIVAEPDRARQLVDLFEHLVTTRKPVPLRLQQYIAWGLESRDPARHLGLIRPKAGKPPATKTTAAEREEYAELLQRRLIGRNRAKRKGEEKLKGAGSVRAIEIERFMDEIGLKSGTGEAWLAKNRADQRAAKKLTGEMIGAGAEYQPLSEIPNPPTLPPAGELLAKLKKHKNIFSSSKPLTEKNKA